MLWYPPAFLQTFSITKEKSAEIDFSAHMKRRGIEIHIHSSFFRDVFPVPTDADAQCAPLRYRWHLICVCRL